MTDADDLKPKMVPVSHTMYESYWREFSRLGPRHANVKRWMVDLGWTAERGVLDAYLAPEAARHG